MTYRNTEYYLRDLLNAEELKEMIAQKRIGVQKHPDLPIFIYNYTARAQYLNEWTTAERVCRGLIVEGGLNGRVIARGPEKFFNYGDTRAGMFRPEDLTQLTVKHDGSLGIGWEYGGLVGVATRGSFTSDQARHATALALLSEEVTQKISQIQNNGLSTCFEIIYPENRIVLDYGDRDELIELGQVDHEFGSFVFRPRDIFASTVMPFSEAVLATVPSDEEGYVLDIQPFGQPTRHVKLKGEEYKRLHALLTNTSGQKIWVELAARACSPYMDREESSRWASLLRHDPEDLLRVPVDVSLDESLLENVPDEFYDWVKAKIQKIENGVHSDIQDALTLAHSVSDLEKRELFEKVKHHKLATEIIRYVNTGKLSHIVLAAWRNNKPSGMDNPFKEKDD